MLDRHEIMKKAIHDCFVELYAKAQPMADYDNIVEEYRSGKLTKDDRVYERHYISHDEYNYIVNKYIDAYNLAPQWKSNVELLEKYLVDGGLKDKYIPEHTDENGNYHPGYRGYENVSPLKDYIKNIIKDMPGDNSSLIEEYSNKMNDKVFELIETCKNFYRFDREEEQFRIAIGLGASPSTDAKSVKKWWKDNYDVDIEIVERNPKLFWYEDMGYTEDDLAMEFEDLGENWREELDKQWKEEKRAEEQKRAERLAKFMENVDSSNNDEDPQE